MVQKYTEKMKRLDLKTLYTKIIIYKNEEGITLLTTSKECENGDKGHTLHGHVEINTTRRGIPLSTTLNLEKRCDREGHTLPYHIEMAMTQPEGVYPFWPCQNGKGNTTGEGIAPLPCQNGKDDTTKVYTPSLSY